MFKALWVRGRGQGPGQGTFVAQLGAEDDSDLVVPLTPHQARRLAAELTAAADQYDPPPPRYRRRGAPPYGWRYVPRGTMRPDLDELATLDRVVTWTLDGYSRAQIAAALTASNVPRRDGVTTWSRDNVRNVQLAAKASGALTEPYTRPARRGGPDPELPLSG